MIRALTLVSQILMIVGLSVVASHAASTDWQDLGGGKARVVAQLDPASYKIEGVVEVELEPGWSTYWRYPGGSGIPPQFDFSASGGLAPVAVQFPAPKKIGEGRRSYAGYKRKVSFPFSAHAGKSAKPNIDLKLLIGVCEEICIPAQAAFNIKASQLFQTDPVAQRQVTFAKLGIPKSVAPQDVKLQVTKAGDKALHISLKKPAGYKNPALFVEGPPKWYLLAPEIISEENDVLTYLLDVSDIPKGVDPLSHPLTYTLSTGNGGIEFSR